MRRSATSGGERALQPDPLTFFIDECLGRKAVPMALRHQGHNVVLLSELFSADDDDTVWLASLYENRKRWIVLTKDKKIRKRSLERLAFISAGVRVFALVSGDLTGENQALAFILALKKIARFARLPGPFIALVTASGHVTMFDRPRISRSLKKHHRKAPK